jgi:predicted Zn-dependent protease
MIHHLRSSAPLALLALILLLLPAAVRAGDEQAWRQRVSAGDAATSSNEDINEEVRFGREVAARMIGRYGLSANDSLNRYVNLVGQVLARSTNRPELTYHFGVLNTTDINAYAAPGGYIFVTRGALDKMRDEAELAGVLAHELTHVNEKHVVRELGIRSTEDSAASGLARLIGGGTETARIAFSQAVDKALDMLFTTGYKREDEVQADQGAIMICAVAGYDPSGLVRYFERISAAKGKSTEVLDKTHPVYDARIALLKDTMSKEGIDPVAYKTRKERFAEAMKKAH